MATRTIVTTGRNTNGYVNNGTEIKLTGTSDTGAASEGIANSATFTFSRIRTYRNTFNIDVYYYVGDEQILVGNIASGLLNVQSSSTFSQTVELTILNQKIITETPDAISIIVNGVDSGNQMNCREGCTFTLNIEYETAKIEVPPIILSCVHNNDKTCTITWSSAIASNGPAGSLIKYTLMDMSSHEPVDGIELTTQTSQTFPIPRYDDAIIYQVYCTYGTDQIIVSDWSDSYVITFVYPMLTAGVLSANAINAVSQKLTWEDATLTEIVNTIYYKLYKDNTLLQNQIISGYTITESGTYYIEASTIYGDEVLTAKTNTITFNRPPTMKYYIDGEWKECLIYYNNNGSWIQVEPYYYTADSWHQCNG